MYLQRYIAAPAGGGEVVIFDRSWYNRAGVERSWASASTTGRPFLEVVPGVEKAMADSVSCS